MDSIDILKFAENLNKDIENKKKGLPYNINVIDELHINENAHSRILCKLLQYKNDEGKYEILESLIKYIINHCRKDSFKKIRVEDPDITQEEQRIDLWVRDNDYAIIIENKVYNAVDRENQISRYIDITKEDSSKGNYKDGCNIYIIYLSQSGKESDDQTWKDYKHEYKDRYINLSFKDNILPWLKNMILPNVRNKEINLKCALGEYIDYLEGLFFMRNEILNNMINDKVVSWLGLDKFTKPEKRISIINQNLQKINELNKALNSVIDKNESKIFSSWKQIVKEKYPKLKFVEGNILQTEISSPITQKLLDVIIWVHPTFRVIL